MSKTKKPSSTVEMLEKHTEIIKDEIQRTRYTDGNEQFVMEKFVELQSVLAELNREQLLLQQIESKKVNRISLFSGFFSVSVAGAALYVALVASQTSERWELNQLPKLEGISNELTELNKTMSTAIQSSSNNIISSNMVDTDRLINAIQKVNTKVEPVDVVPTLPNK